MGLFKKKPDPISERGRELNAKIAALESKIKQLNAQAQKSESSEGRFRSTAYPQGQSPPAAPATRGHAGSGIQKKWTSSR